MTQIDAALFESALVEELRAAWLVLKERHRGAHFYSFGIYTTDVAGYVTVTASTEEGLVEVANRYAKNYGGDSALHKVALRWNPCDSPLHAEGQDLLPRTSLLRSAGPDPYDSSAEGEAAIDLVFDSAFRALKRLDEERLFGDGLSRARLVLSVWIGDQSNEERIRYARALNPKFVADRFAAEIEDGSRAFFELSDKAKWT